MTFFLLAVAFTLGMSFLCSILEAMILSTTIGDIEDLKKNSPAKGRILAKLREHLPDTISSILTVNTIANTLGATLVGGLAIKLFGQVWLGITSALLALSILIFSEIIPKNLGVAYRSSLYRYLVGPLAWLIWIMQPFNWLTRNLVEGIIRKKVISTTSDREIILLAERGAMEGTLTPHESRLVTNSLKLDEVKVSELMTPRTVVFSLEANTSVETLARATGNNLPFARIPVYEEETDHIIGLVRRRDILNALAKDKLSEKVRHLMKEVHFIPETVSAAAALQEFLRTHQQLLVVVDEFGSTAGVITMEDIIECLLGREIFEKDDLAVDMRELARKRFSQAPANTLPASSGSKPAVP